LRQKNGFSLLELLIVVAILSAILISVTNILDVGAITGNPLAEPTDWELATCRFNQNVVQNATEYFGIIHGRYPLNMSELYPWYLDRIPRCPVWDIPYIYNEFHLVYCPHHGR